MLNAVKSNPNDLLSIVRAGGRAVSLTEPFDTELAKTYGINAQTQSTKISTELLTELASLVDKDVIKSTIQRQFSLENIQDALSEFINSSVKGKIIITTDMSMS